MRNVSYLRNLRLCCFWASQKLAIFAWINHEERRAITKLRNFKTTSMECRKLCIEDQVFTIPYKSNKQLPMDWWNSNDITAIFRCDYNSKKRLVLLLIFRKIIKCGNKTHEQQHRPVAMCVEQTRVKLLTTHAYSVCIRLCAQLTSFDKRMKYNEMS